MLGDQVKSWLNLLETKRIERGSSSGSIYRVVKGVPNHNHEPTFPQITIHVFSSWHFLNHILCNSVEPPLTVFKLTTCSCFQHLQGFHLVQPLQQPQQHQVPQEAFLLVRRRPLKLEDSALVLLLVGVLILVRQRQQWRLQLLRKLGDLHLVHLVLQLVLRLGLLPLNKPVVG